MNSSTEPTDCLKCTGQLDRHLENDRTPLAEMQESIGFADNADVLSNSRILVDPDGVRKVIIIKSLTQFSCYSSLTQSYCIIFYEEEVIGMHVNSAGLGMKKVYGVLLSFVLVLCSYGLSFAEPYKFRDSEIKVFEADFGAIEAKLGQVSPSASRSSSTGLNYITYSTTASGYDSSMPINLFSEGDEIYLVNGLFCSGAGKVVVYFFLTSPVFGTVYQLVAPEWTVEESGFYRFPVRLKNGLPAGTYKLQVVSMLDGGMVLSPEGYSFFVLE